MPIILKYNSAASPLLHRYFTTNSQNILDFMEARRIHSYTFNVENSVISCSELGLHGSSIQFDGTTDYITHEVHEDFDLLSDTFTLETFYKASTSIFY